MKTVFLDLGANKGQSINLALQTLLHNKDYLIYSFETLPLFVTKLKKYFSNNSKIQIYHAAVWDKDGKEKFYVSPKSTESGTMLLEKNTGGIEKENFIKVPTINFSKWIKNNLNKEDYIILKFDIEGGEYRVLKKMIEDGTINYINEFKGEFHYDKLKHTSELVDTINYVHDYFNKNNIKFQRWEVGYKLGLVDYKLGTKPSLQNSKILDYDKEGKKIFYDENTI
tara:strand:- start:4238 stop:4912 length:675 start_codon:yes stop_codon:yes gene_type:complete